MKKLFNPIALCMLILLSSCTNTIYDIKAMRGYYDIRMNNEEELEIKSKVRIFQSEREVNSNYKVISHVTYKPIVLPIFMNKQKEYLKTLYESAAKQAYKLGGNGVIITSYDSYKVISIDSWDSDSEKSMAYLNMIYDTELLEKFNNGTVEKAKRRESIRYVNEMKTEIEFNIYAVKNLEEVLIIEQKLDALLSYINSQATLEGLVKESTTSIASAYNNFETLLDKVVDADYIEKNRKTLMAKAMVIASAENKVLTTGLLDKFNNGTIDKLPVEQRYSCCLEFLGEIKYNLENAKNRLEDLPIIDKKIQTITTWNNAQNNAYPTLTKLINEVEKSYGKLEVKANEVQAKKLAMTEAEKAMELAHKEAKDLILNTNKMEDLDNGIVAKMSSEEAANFISEYKKEIESNIQNAEKLDEVVFIEKKLDALQSYNNTLNEYDKELEKFYIKNHKALVKTAMGIAKQEKRMLNTIVVEKYENGTINKLPSKLIEYHTEALLDEIQFNLQHLRTYVDVSIVTNKINTLQAWNISQAEPDKKLEETLQLYRITLKELTQ